MTQNIDFLLE